MKTKDNGLLIIVLFATFLLLFTIMWLLAG